MLDGTYAVHRRTRVLIPYLLLPHHRRLLHCLLPRHRGLLRLCYPYLCRPGRGPGPGTLRVPIRTRQAKHNPMLVARFTARIQSDAKTRMWQCLHLFLLRPRSYHLLSPARRGKKYAVALAKERDLDGLKQFAPHIVRSQFVPGKLFCRITGRYVQAGLGA